MDFLFAFQIILFPCQIIRKLQREIGILKKFALKEIYTERNLHISILDSVCGYLSSVKNFNLFLYLVCRNSTRTDGDHSIFKISLDLVSLSVTW